MKWKYRIIKAEHEDFYKIQFNYANKFLGFLFPWSHITTKNKLQDALDCCLECLKDDEEKRRPKKFHILRVFMP